MTMPRMILPLKMVHKMISMMLSQVSWFEKISEELNRRADSLYLELKSYIVETRSMFERWELVLHLKTSISLWRISPQRLIN